LRSAAKAAKEARDYWLNQCEVGEMPEIKKQAQKLVESYDRIIQSLLKLELDSNGHDPG